MENPLSNELKKLLCIKINLRLIYAHVIRVSYKNEVFSHMICCLLYIALNIAMYCGSYSCMFHNIGPWYIIKKLHSVYCAQR